MSKYLIILIATIVFSSACGNLKPTPVNSNVTPNTAPTAKTDSNTAMPPTERKTSGDYVDSESGTEKAKPDAGKANVQGKVLFDGKPVEGVEVKICEKFNRYVGGCDGESFKTKTNANGEYVLTKVTPKDYESLMVQVFNTKNYIFATGNYGISSAKYKFEADKTFFAPDTKIFKDDLKILSPKPKSKNDPKTLELKWDAYPDAAYYKIRLSGSDVNTDSPYLDERVEGTSFKIDKPVAAGTYRLTVSAYNAADEKLADNDDQLEFTIASNVSDATSK